MTLTPTFVLDVADRLDAATQTARTTAQPSLTTPLTIDQAYTVQRRGLSLRAARGDGQVGVKLGFTSKAKAEQMGVSDVIAGVVTRTMRVEDGGALDVGSLIHARVEPEIAFRFDETIDVDDDTDPVSAVGAIAPALEIIDSRYSDFRFSLEDVVADNTSAARFVVGAWTPMEDVADTIDLASLDVTMSIDGDAVASGTTGAILGHPLRALEAIKRMASLYGHVLPSGTILLAGAATEAVPLPDTSGAVVVSTVAGLGGVSVRIVKRGEA